MGVGEQHHRCEGRAGVWRKPPDVGECRRRCREREPCAVSGRIGCEPIAASERWDDGVGQGECVWGQGRLGTVFGRREAGLYVVRADGVGVGHGCGVRGGWRDRSEHAGSDERRAACGEHERSDVGGLGMVKHGSPSERWRERVHACHDLWSRDGAGGALSVSEAGAEHVRADGLGIRQLGAVRCGGQVGGQHACVDERGEGRGEPVGSDIGGSWGPQCSAWERCGYGGENRDRAWSEDGGEGMERVYEVRPDGMRADRVGIGHIGMVSGWVHQI